MTAQIPNTVVFRKMVYDIIGLENGRLFYPEDFGFRPSMIHTACCDGFFARYLIRKSGLYLERLTIYSEDQVYPHLNRIAPKPSRQEYGCMFYDRVFLPIPYTGAIRLGRDFINRYYVHLGYQKPSGYETVIDCFFRSGALVRCVDRSREAAAIRGRFRNEFNSFSDGSAIDLIDHAFSLDMELR